MDLVYVDKLAKDNNGVKYILVRQDLFDRTPDAKGMKTKNTKETVRSFLTTVTKKNQTEKKWVDRGTKFAGEFEKLGKAEGVQNYSTFNETKAAFAEPTKRDPSKIYFTVTWKTIDTSTFTTWLKSLQQ